MPTFRHSVSTPRNPAKPQPQIDRFDWPVSSAPPDRFVALRKAMEAGDPLPMGDGKYQTVLSVHSRVNPFDKRSLSAVVHSECS